MEWSFLLAALLALSPGEPFIGLNVSRLLLKPLFLHYLHPFYSHVISSLTLHFGFFRNHLSSNSGVISSPHSGASAQFNLTQPESMSASLGDPIRLPCTLSGAFTFAGSEWIQHKGGKSPRFLLRHILNGSKIDLGPGVSGGFSVSVDATKKVTYLTATNVRAEDEATYYCLLSSGTGHQPQ